MSLVTYIFDFVIYGENGTQEYQRIVTLKSRRA